MPRNFAPTFSIGCCSPFLSSALYLPCSRPGIRADPAFGEFAGLDIFERGFHAFLDAGINDQRVPRKRRAPLGGFGDGKAQCR